MKKITPYQLYIEKELLYRYFDYKKISRLDKDISIFSEFVGIWYPDYTYYVLSDDSKLSDDLRWRKGVWGIKGPGVALKFNNRYEMKFSFNYNSATFIPNYFNSTYFYNRVRYYRDDDISYPLVIKQINMIEDNFSVSGNNDEYFIPKDIFPTLLGNDGFSAYPVFGFTTEHSYHIYKYVDVSLSAAMFVEDSDQAKQYYSFETSIEINDNFDDKTIIIIAHRKTTIEKCDKVWNLKNGSLDQ